ncbi:QueT transporter family protein [Paludicola sp. MB14-C6]|uniref:QueT transporter family protein n=1 Tax=Paludihabitans sp. MB14-C6 TaxID=3070656 RepID=UPI0027DAE4F5|nr:QueT transporter family protein [Paludicola sp. MB14-C6]WMJ23272.1 QueT transporter family protein [Paludicola sp. MB14-C6]
MSRTRKVVQSALIAALYAALTLAIPVLSFNILQFRIGESLTILPVYTGTAIPGLTLGCILSNLIGFFTQANPIGWLDAIVGSFATLIASILTYYIGKSKKQWIRYGLSPLPPVLINAVIIGLELTFVFSDISNIPVLLTNVGSVLIGQAVICYGLGLPLMLFIDKNKAVKNMLASK